MAETGFWAFLKRLFGMQCEELHERYCLGCHKVTQGTLSPKPDAQAMSFTCKACSKQTQLLS